MKIDLSKIEEAARAAGQGGEHVYSHPRDSNLWQQNEDWIRMASPALFLKLCEAVRAARRYFDGYVQDEAADGEHDDDKPGDCTGCSPQQKRDAFDLREALKDIDL